MPCARIVPVTANAKATWLSDGLFDGRFRVLLTIQLLDRERFTATATLGNLTLDGTTLLAPPLPGFTVHGTRMRVIRE
jgi:hypothetical protein